MVALAAIPSGVLVRLEALLLVMLEPLQPFGIAVKRYNPELGVVQNYKDVLAAVGGTFPAVMVGIEGGPNTTMGTGKTQFSRDTKAQILVLSADLLGPDGQALGGPGHGDPGVLRMIDAVHFLLAGQKVADPQVGTLQPVFDQPWRVEPGLVAWQMTYVVPTWFSKAEDGGPTLESILTNLNIPAPDDDANPVVVVETAVTPP